MGQIRLCNPEDLPGVAELFRLVFRNGEHLSASALSSYFHRIYFQNPWYDHEISSRVFISEDGLIQGFMGILALSMSFSGKRVKGAIACSLMVDPCSKDRFAGARLLRSIMRGPQDLTVGDSANAVARSIIEQLGGEVSPLDSLNWFRVIRPASHIVTRASDRLDLLPERPLLSMASLADRIILRVSPRAAFQPKRHPGYTVRDVSRETFAEAAPRLLDTFEIRPDWHDSDWVWWLSELECKQRYGGLVRCLVVDGAHEVVGGFLYFNRPQDVAHVVQVLARRGLIRTVVDAMMAHVHETDCAAVRGQTQPLLIGELFRYGCTFRHRASSLYFTKDPGLLTAFRAGRAMIGGPVGEAWTRWVSDEFSENELQPASL